MFQLWLLLGCFSLELLLGISLDLQPQCFKVNDNRCPNANVTFWLYTKQEPYGRLLHPENINELYLNPKPLKVLIHSLAGNRSTTPNLELRPKLLRFRNLNILSVDYENLTPDPCYIETTFNIRLVARCLAEFLGDLVSNDLVRTDQIHLIGFGLGAHAAAFTANNLEKMYSRVSRITGLDPSKALYLTPELDDRLDANDAAFVDVIHTDIFVHGLMQPVGHVDFYPNKGVVQPRCGPIDNIITHECYHKRAADYYAESVFSYRKFWGFRCKDLYDFIVGACRPSKNLQELGYHTPNTARGNYFLATNHKPPFARGLNFANMDRKLDGKTYMPNELLEKLSEMKGAARRLTSTI